MLTFGINKTWPKLLIFKGTFDKLFSDISYFSHQGSLKTFTGKIKKYIKALKN